MCRCEREHLSQSKPGRGQVWQRVKVWQLIRWFCNIQTWSFRLLKWSCFVNFSPSKLVEQQFTRDHQLEDAKHISWTDKTLFIQLLCGVQGGGRWVKGALLVSSARVHVQYVYAYKPYYSPHFISHHSINSCDSENCKNVKHGWVRGQTKTTGDNQIETTEWESEMESRETKRQHRTKLELCLKIFRVLEYCQALMHIFCL